MGAEGRTAEGEPFAAINGMFADPLARYAIETGDDRAGRMARGLCGRLLAQRGGLWAARNTGYFYESRSELSALAGLMRTALAWQNRKWLDRGKEMLDFVVSEGLSTGHFPWKNHLACEPCMLADVIDVAIVLARNGYSEYWDLVDRCVRNQFVEGMVRSPAVLQPRGRRKKKNDPNASYHEVGQRVVGGYTMLFPNRLDSKRLMLCCGGSVNWMLGKVWQNIVTDEGRCVSVNLALNHVGPLATVSSREPFEGHVQILPATNKTLRARLPVWVNPDDVKTFVSGKDRPVRVKDGWVHFPAGLKGKKLRVQYPIARRETEESVTIIETRHNRQHRLDYCAQPETYNYAIDWRGGTATSVTLVSTQGPVRFAEAPKGPFATYKKRRFAHRPPAGSKSYFSLTEHYDW